MFTKSSVSLNNSGLVMINLFLHKMHETMTIIFLLFITAPAQSVAGRAGKIDGVMSWLVPRTQYLQSPQQSWYSAGSAPNGDLYFSVCDHATNAELFRIDVSNDTCYYAGDARSASQAVNNWKTGETCEKFHTRPTYFKGRVYVS